MNPLVNHLALIPRPPSEKPVWVELLNIDFAGGGEENLGKDKRGEHPQS